jgi:hypothetical protein
VDDGARTLRVRGSSVGCFKVLDELLRPNLVRVATAEVKTGLEDSGSLAVTTSFLGEMDRETDPERGLTLELSESKSSRSRLIARAAEDFVGANKRDLAGSRCEDRAAKG